LEFASKELKGEFHSGLASAPLNLKLQVGRARGVDQAEDLGRVYEQIPKTALMILGDRPNHFLDLRDREGRDVARHVLIDGERQTPHAVEVRLEGLEKVSSLNGPAQFRANRLHESPDCIFTCADRGLVDLVNGLGLGGLVGDTARCKLKVAFQQCRILYFSPEHPPKTCVLDAQDSRSLGNAKAGPSAPSF